MLYNALSRFDVGISASHRTRERIPPARAAINTKYIFINMKKTIIALMALAGVATAGGELDTTNTLLFAFGTNGGGNVDTKLGSFLGTDNLTYNIISTSNSAAYTTGENALKYADGSTATGFAYKTGACVSGENGRVTTITNADKVNKIFDTNVMKGVDNYDGGVTFTLSGLTTGQSYTLYVFAARGNEYGGTEKSDTNTYGFSAGAGSITAKILDYTLSNSLVTQGYTTPTINNSSITAYTQSNDGVAQTSENWVLMSFDFKATDTTVMFSASGGGCGNIAAVGLTTSVPEPTTATLSLLALAGLAARRRRR